jgi:hypothetical protein
MLKKLVAEIFPQVQCDNLIHNMHHNLQQTFFFFDDKAFGEFCSFDYYKSQQISVNDSIRLSSKEKCDVSNNNGNATDHHLNSSCDQ